MIRSGSTLVALAASFVLVSPTLGQTPEETIIAATLEHFQTMNAGDAQGHVAHHVPNVTSFDAAGGLLYVSESRDQEARLMQAGFDAGWRQNYELRHLEVRVYGDAAVVTGYVAGVDVAPDGTETPVLNRRTAVLVRQDGQWLEVHSHQSPVVGAAQQ